MVSIPDLAPAFRGFLEAAPDAIIMAGRTGRIVFVNSLTAEMFGYTREELRGQRVELLVPRDLWGRRKSGEEFPIQISRSPIETERGTLTTSIIRDVTALRQAESRFRGLLEAAPDGIVVVDSTGRIVIVNSQTERMFGYARQQLIGEPIEILVPDRFRDVHIADRDAYLGDPRTRPMGAGRALTGRKRDGTEFPIEISLSPLRTESENLVMSIVRDISERRRAEELLQASLREKEALLKEIHHRVKNNLQVTSSLLRLQAGTIEDARVREVFEQTQSRIRSMALVHEKLYQSSNLAQIDFGDYIRSLAALLFQSCGVDENHIRLDVGGDDVLLTIETAVPCGLIVNEVLSNALKHAFPGNGYGRIHVHLTNLEDGGRELTIRDDGVGLPDELDVEQGETLGLRLVRALVQQINGRIAVERRAPGAKFTITVPAERSR